MSTIKSYLEADHARCDALFAQAESAVGSGDWQQAAAALDLFAAALGRHLAMEEDVLFPAFEQATGNAAGPTAVMRSEHHRLRDITADARTALERRASDDFFAAAETMQIMMGQHNLKEEGILYPMADRFLKASAERLLDAMRSLPQAGAVPA